MILFEVERLVMYGFTALPLDSLVVMHVISDTTRLLVEVHCSMQVVTP